MNNRLRTARELIGMVRQLVNERTASGSYKNIYTQLVEKVDSDNTPLGNKMKNFIDQDILNGVFSDGNGHGYVENGSNGSRIPDYAYNYIMKFIKEYRG